MTLCEPDTALQEPDGGPGGVRGVGAPLPLVVHRQNLQNQIKDMIHKHQASDKKNEWKIST